MITRIPISLVQNAEYLKQVLSARFNTPQVDLCYAYINFPGHTARSIGEEIGRSPGNPDPVGTLRYGAPAQ